MGSTDDDRGLPRRHRPFRNLKNGTGHGGRSAFFIAPAEKEQGAFFARHASPAASRGGAIASKWLNNHEYDDHHHQQGRHLIEHAPMTRWFSIAVSLEEPLRPGQIAV